MKKWGLAVTVMSIAMVLVSSFSLAQHMHGGGMGGGMKMETKDVLVEGTKVSFMVMDNEAHKKMLADMKM